MLACSSNSLNQKHEWGVERHWLPVCNHLCFVRCSCSRLVPRFLLECLIVSVVGVVLVEQWLVPRGPPMAPALTPLHSWWTWIRATRSGGVQFAVMGEQMMFWWIVGEVGCSWFPVDRREIVLVVLGLSSNEVACPRLLGTWPRQRLRRGGEITSCEQG